MDWLDFIDSGHALSLAPLKTLDGGATVRRSCIRIADVDGEEIQGRRVRAAFFAPAQAGTNLG